MSVKRSYPAAITTSLTRCVDTDLHDVIRKQILATDLWLRRQTMASKLICMILVVLSSEKVEQRKKKMTVNFNFASPCLSVYIWNSSWTHQSYCCRCLGCSSIMIHQSNCSDAHFHSLLGQYEPGMTCSPPGQGNRQQSLETNVTVAGCYLSLIGCHTCYMSWSEGRHQREREREEKESRYMYSSPHLWGCLVLKPAHSTVGDM